MKRFNIDTDCITPELCKDIQEALINEDTVILSIDDFDSANVKITDRGITLTDVFWDRPKSDRKYQGTEYEEVIWIDEDDERKIEVKLELKCYFEIVNIDSDYIGRMWADIKISKKSPYWSTGMF